MPATKSLPSQMQLADTLANLARYLANRRRQMPHNTPPDYVMLDVTGDFVERDELQPWPLRLLPQTRKPSIEGFRHALELIAEDPLVKGVVLRIRDLNSGLATVQSLRYIVQRFRRSSKRVVAYVPDIDLRSYYLATVADEIVAPESATFMVLGLALQSVFLKDALGRWGISGDFIAVSPYKSAADQLTRSDMSQEVREQFNWLLDANWEEALHGIAVGRRMSKERAAELLNDTPMLAPRAVEVGLIDRLLYEDELGAYLGGAPTVLPWMEALPKLYQPYVWHAEKAIAVISVEGAITPGESRRPPFPFPMPVIPESRAGAETVLRTFRQAEKDDNIAAIVLYINSPGGDALASDLICREVQRVRGAKPVVAYMGDVAASGGYYVATHADHIVAQASTITGSIGVIIGKVVTGGLYQKLHANIETLQRGDHATILGSDDAFTDSERKRLHELLLDMYSMFKHRVEDGRKLDASRVEEMAQGKVWTGRQALDLGLVDELGDFEVAVRKARQLAGLPEERKAVVVPLGAPRMPMVPATLANPQAWVADLRASFDWLLDTRVLALLPFEVKLK